MNHWNIILGIGTILGLYFFRKIKPTYLKVIFIGFSISFALPYFEKQEITNIGYFGFGLFSILYLIHCLIKKNIPNIIISIFAFFSFVSMYMGFPFANERKLMMIIPIITYFITLKKIRQYENEISILTILTSYELAELMNIQFE